MVERGVSPVIGLVLLIGLVAATSVIILVTAGGVMTDIQQQAEQERAEQAMVELNSQLTDTTKQPDTWREAEVGTGMYGSVVREETGSITVESDALTEDIDAPIGTVEWVGDDGTKIASEAGAVFRETGDETRVISAPPFNYDRSTNTFNVPVVTVSGEQELGGESIRVTTSDTAVPTDTSVIEDEDVVVSVDSEYCVGWETYFVTEVGEHSIQEYCGDNERVTAKLGYLDIQDSFESEVNVDPDGGTTQQEEHGNPLGNTSTGQHEPLDDLIDGLIEDAAEPAESELELEGSGSTLADLGEAPITDGMYFIEGDLVFPDGEPTEFDLQEGNVTLIVEGDIRGGGDVHATDPDDTALRIYSGGDVLDIGGEICTQRQEASGCVEESEHVQIYGTSDMAIDFGPGGTQGAHFEGLIYAASDRDKNWSTSPGNGPGENPGEGGPPCSGYQFAYMAGDEEFYGSIVVYSACGHSAGQEPIEYDESLDEVAVFPPEITPTPGLTYLNVAVHETEVKSG